MREQELLDPREYFQPTGIRAFGWGLLGFLGSNIIINIIATIGVLVADAFVNYWLLSILTIIVTIIVAFWAANEFRLSRKYDATATGIAVSMFLQGVLLAVGFYTGLTA